MDTLDQRYCDFKRCLLNKRDLKLSWHVGQEAAGTEGLSRAPERAYFFWSDGGTVAFGVDFLENELEDVIQRFLREGLTVPTEVEEALRRLKRVDGAASSSGASAS